MNDCKFRGNLTADPELRYTPSGTAVVSFRIATNRRWKNNQGELMDEVTFHNIEAWEKKAEAITKYLQKGDPILIARSHAKNESWEDKSTGQKRYRDKYVIDEFEFINGKRDRAEEDGVGDDQDAPQPSDPKTAGKAAARGNGRRRTATEPVTVPSGGGDVEDDIPF
jgi:single-strand DNA-binding protein